MQFKLSSSFKPAGDQISAIRELSEGIGNGQKNQTLLGVTGSGKTFTIANVIQEVQLPTLVISHNKVLAAQLFEEFKAFFPENAVEYFVSFYDYYQPEAYIPSTDTYIEKTADINQEIDRLRLKATSSLMSRRDVVIVASVSCIYNIGSPESYAESSIPIRVGDGLDRDEFFRQLVMMQYQRNDQLLDRRFFRVRGDIIEIYPAYEECGLRIETFGTTIENLSKIDVITGKVISQLESYILFPAKHFVNTKVSMKDALAQIEKELNEQLARFEDKNKIVEAHRLKQRTRYDMEMLAEVGYVNGIENYSRIFDGRPPGSRPYSLIDFFRQPFLLVVDESHVSIPQIRGMYNGDRARKETLVEHGFRIPSALDNRPLMFHEFEQLADFVIYSSATPGDYELQKCEGVIVEQIIRPTGLVDPPIEVRPAASQIDDLIEELRLVVERKERALVTTLTKKMSEDLTGYLENLDFKIRYLHSEIDTLERPVILKELREGVFDVLVGINLLREGLDLPEVTLVAILDADREGFLRSHRSIIQIAGRAARNTNGKIILYADTITGSMKKAIDESTRRREKQLQYNKEHNIIPQTVVRQISDSFSIYQSEGQAVSTSLFEDSASYQAPSSKGKKGKDRTGNLDIADIPRLESEMLAAAKNLEFERAAQLRDLIALISKNKG